jgi:hypothetical protein
MVDNLIFVDTKDIDRSPSTGALRRISHYRVEGALDGEDSASSVYTCSDTRQQHNPERLFALKKIVISQCESIEGYDEGCDDDDNGNAGDPDAFFRMFPEVGILKAISHPNIVALHAAIVVIVEPHDIYLGNVIAVISISNFKL